MKKDPSIAVVIPCYNVGSSVHKVISFIGSEVAKIYVVDDQCPQRTGIGVQQDCHDPRVAVIFNQKNLGVGGATLRGFAQALKDGHDIIVKIDGDGQMDGRQIIRFVNPIVRGWADYTKGNRFFNLEDVATMPRARLVGNALLSFFSKLSTGYWNIFDPTNGFIAVHARVLDQIPFERINPRFFFETDMLFRLNTLRAVVVDVPMTAVYGQEQSNLVISREIFRFLIGHGRNFLKRIFYNYFLRSFSIASIELLLGLGLLIFGVSFGAVEWIKGYMRAVVASSGTVMLSALPIVIGTQLLLAFLSHDIESVPRQPIHRHF